MKICAVVVTYNRKAKLLACLGALSRQSVPCDVLVVDNASTDGTAEALSSPSTLNLRPSTFTYLNTGSNLGGAGGFAFGIERAAAKGYDRVWIMDDDVLPEPDALEKLNAAEQALPDDWGWLSSKCLMKDGSLCPMNHQRATPFKRIPSLDIQSTTSGLLPAEMATFVSLYFKSETVRRFGLPVAEFFIWCDDLEWTRRVSCKQPCFVVPSSVVVHDIGGSAASNVAVDAPERVPRYFYAFRNEFRVYRREGLRGLAYYFAKVALNLARITFCARGHRLARYRALFSGFFAGLRTSNFVETPLAT